MVKVYCVQGRNLKEIQSQYKFLNGYVYVIDDSKKANGEYKDDAEKPKVYIWLGSKAFADDRGVGAWAAEQLDMKHKAIDVDTEVEGEESPEFKKLINFQVVEGDTPGFLKHTEVNWEDIDYEMYRVHQSKNMDDVNLKPVPISSKSLDPNDVFVVDAWHDIYVWIGSKSQTGEKTAGSRLARKLDTDRKRNPKIYVIDDGSEPKGFFELIDKIGREDPRKSSGKQVKHPRIEKSSEQTEGSKKKRFFCKIFGK